MTDSQQRPQRIYEPHDQVLYLNSLGENKLREWIKNALFDKYNPICGLGRDEEIDSRILYLSRSSEPLKKKVSKEVVALLKSSAVNVEGSQFLFRLMYLAGKLGVKESYEILLQRAEMGEYKDVKVQNVFCYQGDLHQHCLQVLGGRAPLDDVRLLRVCLRDIKPEENTAYFGICYHILIDKFSDPAEYIKDYFPRLVDLSRSETVGRLDFCNFFHNFFDNPKARESFTRDMGSIFNSLSVEQLLFVGTEIEKRKTGIEKRAKEPPLLPGLSSPRKRPDDYLLFLETALAKIGEILAQSLAPAPKTVSGALKVQKEQFKF
ncbi:MAG: hypothetical protein PHY92_02745 [Alphaproteobacteria bacterium]|nr:hypothetical protein [Alphaproteobacteria bacterium]